MIPDHARFIFTDALLTHPFIKRTVMWGAEARARATFIDVRHYIKEQSGTVLFHSQRRTQFDYCSFYHALKWELERLEREAREVEP